MIPEKQILYLLASGGYLEVNVAVAYLWSRICIEELKKCELLQYVVHLAGALRYKRVPFEFSIDPLLSGHTLGFESTKRLTEMSKGKK